MKFTEGFFYIAICDYQMINISSKKVLNVIVIELELEIENVKTLNLFILFTAKKVKFLDHLIRLITWLDFFARNTKPCHYQFRISRIKL